MKFKLLYAVLAVLVASLAIAPAATTHAYDDTPMPVAYEDAYTGDQGVYETVLPEGYAPYTYDYGENPTYWTEYEPYQIAQSLDISLDTSSLFTGAQTMIDALSSPYLLIAGFALGVSILAAIMKAVTSLRL